MGWPAAGGGRLQERRQEGGERVSCGEPGAALDGGPGVQACGPCWRNSKTGRGCSGRGASEERAAGGHGGLCENLTLTHKKGQPLWPGLTRVSAEPPDSETRGD